MKKREGITLIALVVTIIVLIILASVSIRLVLGNNGIVKKASDAKILTELGKVNEALELYKVNNSMENNNEPYGDENLIENEKLVKQVTAIDTSRRLLVLKDLNEINTKSSIGKGWKSEELNLDKISSIESIYQLDDVYVKDLTDGELYYIENGTIWSVSGSTQIAEFPYEKVEAVVEEWKAIENADNTVSIVQYLGNNTEIVIPNYYKGKRVKEIRMENDSPWQELIQDMTKYTPVFMPNTTVVEYWEENGGETTIPVNNMITKIEISEGIERIGNLALAGCISWTGKLVIPNSVTSIGEYAFGANYSLTGDLIIPDSVKTIGQYAFVRCKSLNGKLQIGKGLEKIEGFVFNSCSELTGDIIIPDNIKSIGNNAFALCEKMNGKLIIGNQVETIGDFAFTQCGNLTGDLVIPDSVKKIGKNAFASCEKWNGKLIIGNSVKEIGDYAFNFCGNLTGTVRIRKDITLGEYPFAGCDKLTVIYEE